MQVILVLYFLVLNTTAFLAFAIDKTKAARSKWRISESLLLLLAFAGGAAGALFGMLCFRHKTRKTKFLVLVPLFLFLHILLLVILVP